MRSAPAPNLLPIPGMNLGVVVGAGDGGSGDGDGNAGEGGDSEGASGGSGGDDASGDNRSAPDPQKYPTCGTESHPVDVVTGRVFTHPVTDLALPGPLPFSFQRSYSSAACRHDQGLGPGWAHSLGWFVEVSRTSVRVWNEKGISVAFSLPPIGHTVLGDWGWVLRREPWGFAVDANDDVWRVFSTSFDDGKTLRLTAIDDRNRNRIALAYEDGRLVQVVDSAGRVVKITSTTQGRIASIQVKNAQHQGRWVAFARYDYDAEGRLVRVTDAEDYAWTYSYDERNRLVRDTDRVGLSFCFRYDAQDRGIEAWGEYLGEKDPSLAEDLPGFLADGRTRAKGIYHRKFDYYPRRYTEVTDSTETRRYYGNKKGMLDKGVTGGAVTSSTYDDRGFEIQKTDPMGATTRWVRDERGRALEIVDPLGRITRIGRDPHGLPIQIIDPAGGVTRSHRDQRGNVEIVTDAAGNTTHLAFDERGLRTSVTAPTGAMTRYRYDAHGNLVEAVLANGAVWTNGWDAFGRGLFSRDPTGVEVRSVYSARGNLIAFYDAAGGVTRYAYDGEGRLVQFTSPSGHVTSLEWGGFHKLCARRDANGTVVRLAYDREGMLVTVFNERGETHRYFYNSSGRLVGEETFDGRKLRYRNDAAGRGIRSESNARETTELVWDLAGQLVARKLPDGTSESFEYDARGRLVCATNAAGECRFEFDELGRVVRESQSVGGEEHWVAVTYDRAGGRAGVTTSLGHTQRIERDVMGARVRTWLDGDRCIEHSSDVFAQEVQRRLPAGGVVESVFDPVGRVAQRIARSPFGARLVGPGEPEWMGRRDDGITAMTSYSYDADGETVTKTDRTRGVTRRDYDPIGQLVAVVPENARAEVFRFDARGNVEEAGDGLSHRVYGAGNRLERKDNSDYLWDDDGRLVERREPTAQGPKVWKYEWDGAGLLAAVQMPEGKRVEYDYDPFARRVEKRVRERDGLAWRTAKRTRFVLDGNVLAHEIEHYASVRGDPVVEEKTYWFEDRSFTPVAHRVDGEWFHYVNDPGGIPEQLVDERGEIACVLEWRAWGHAEAAPASRTTTSLRLPGQYEDLDVGLSYNRARYYSPDLARFISPDPIGGRGGTNEYRYPRNPFRYRDPLGLDPNPNDSPAQQAHDWQGSPQYPGHDDWHDIVLKKGTVVCLGEPGVSGFATTQEAVKSCGDPPSALAVQQGLQVMPSKNPDGSPKYPPRGTYGEYTLTRDTPAAYCASTTANPQYGAGGLPQYYIPGVSGAKQAHDDQSPADPRFTRTGGIPCAP
jgi:RHS repeat-associated protein